MTILRLFIDPIRDNGDINGVAVMFILGIMVLSAFIIFEKLTDGKY